MKSHYKKTQPWHSDDPEDAIYELRWHHYYRRVRTFQELRRNYGDWDEFRDEPHIKGIRRRRSKGLLNSWNDFGVSRNWKKSWKDHTKFEKQWMTGGGDIAQGEPSVSFQRIMAGLEDALAMVTAQTGKGL